jgi:hypothetical protein
LLRLCGLEQIPRDVIEDVPAPPGLGRLKKVEIDPVDPLAKDGILQICPQAGWPLTSGTYHGTARVSTAARRRPFLTTTGTFVDTHSFDIFKTPDIPAILERTALL